MTISKCWSLISKQLEMQRARTRLRDVHSDIRCTGDAAVTALSSWFFLAKQFEKELKFDFSTVASAVVATLFFFAAHQLMDGARCQKLLEDANSQIYTNDVHMSPQTMKSQDKLTLMAHPRTRQLKANKLLHFILGLCVFAAASEPTDTVPAAMAIDAIEKAPAAADVFSASAASSAPPCAVAATAAAHSAEEAVAAPRPSQAFLSKILIFILHIVVCLQVQLGRIIIRILNVCLFCMLGSSVFCICSLFFILMVCVAGSLQLLTA